MAETLKNRILRNVSMIPFSGCWIWMGAAKPSGYGNINVAGKTMQTHRAAWLAFNGSLDARKNICHECDVPSCVNPDHLFVGTQQENVRDMDFKGRRVTVDKSGVLNPMFGKQHSQATCALMATRKAGAFVGSKHPRSTITEDIAREVLSCQGKMTAREAASKMNVSWHVVRNIWSGKSWGFING